MSYKTRSGSASPRRVCPRRAPFQTILLVVVAASCVSWGATEFTTGPFSYGTDASGQLTAIAANFEAAQQRHPGAVLFYPGSIQRVNFAGALTWLCDANAKQVRSLGLVPLLATTIQGNSPVPQDSLEVADWKSDNFAIRNPHTILWFRVWISGVDSATAVPSDTLRSSQAIAPYCQSALDSLRAVPAAKLTWSGH